MSRNRLDELYQHCADLNVMVEWADLGATRHGEYDWRRNVIRLNWRMTRAQSIACLAHELGHVFWNDLCSSPAAERRAWRYGAAVLITPEEYAAAEEAVGCHAGAMAAELDVTPRLIHAWRDWWRSRPEHLATN